MTRYAYEYGKRWNEKTSRASIIWLVNRMHVDETEDTSKAAIAARIPENPAFTPAIHRECVAYALECHARNRGLYSRVMRGA